MTKSAYLRTRLVKHTLGLGAYTPPSNTYLALFTSNPTINNTGIEAVGGSYARQAITWGAEANGNVPSSGIITFTNLPAGTFSHWGIFDALTGGNLLHFSEFEIPISRTAGQGIAIASAKLNIYEV